MTDIVFNAKNATLRRVRLKPSLSNTALLYSPSNCYLNSTPINNFALPPPPPCVFSRPSSLSVVKSADRALKPSLRKMESTGSESNATTTAIIKSVHFNDPLTRVVHFYTPPPLDEYDEDDDEETEEDEEEEEEEEGKLEDAFLELYMVHGLKDECDSLAIAQPPTRNSLAANNSTVNGSLSLPNWPLTIHPARRFISQMVSLESLVWNHSLQVVQGRVLVHNLAFAKRITVRCSFDDWKTWTDIDAYYKESAFHGGGLSDVNHSAFDRFMFELHVPNVHAFSCDLAVRYQTLGQEFWDNNNGNNFTVQSMPFGSTLGEPPLSLFKAILQQEHDSNSSNYYKEGLSITPTSTFNIMERPQGSNHHHHQENIKQGCRHNRDGIVSQQQPATTTKMTAKSRHLLDKFKFSKYGASKIPAAPVPAAVSQKSTMQQQQRPMMDKQLVVVDLSEQLTDNCNGALVHSNIMDNHDEAVDLKETLYTYHSK